MSQERRENPTASAPSMPAYFTGSRRFQSTPRQKGESRNQYVFNFGPKQSAKQPSVKRKTILYSDENRISAQLFLSDPVKYAGIQLEWATVWWERNGAA